MTTTISAPTHSTSSPTARRRVVQVLAILGILVALWLVTGLVRADGVARDYFARIHDGQTVTNVEIQLSPAILPFWSASIDGDVTQPGQTNVVYQSHMNIWVEPITGWVILMSAG